MSYIKQGRPPTTMRSPQCHATDAGYVVPLSDPTWTKRSRSIANSTASMPASPSRAMIRSVSPNPNSQTLNPKTLGFRILGFRGFKAKNHPEP